MHKKFPEKKILQVHEPGSTPIAQDIRTLAQAKTWDDDFMHPLTNAYLYAASRAQLIHTKLIPELHAGSIIVSDRSFLSSLAYQGEAQRLGFDKVMSINADAIEDLIPDIVLYIDTNIDTAMNRVFDAKGDKWETMGRQFYLDTQRGYEKCAQLEMLEGRFFRINGNRDPGDVAQQIRDIVNNFYDKTAK